MCKRASRWRGASMMLHEKESMRIQEQKGGRREKFVLSEHGRKCCTILPGSRPEQQRLFFPPLPEQFFPLSVDCDGHFRYTRRFAGAFEAAGGSEDLCVDLVFTTLPGCSLPC
eukprot:767846-Hanusia_phi.AAC.1